MLKNAVKLSHFYLENFIKDGAFAVDATCGNGGDTLFLAELVGENGIVFGFDIQKEAIQNTRLRLENAKLSDRVQLFLDGHENMEHYLDSQLVDAVVFNLGYLPKGDHSLHTKPKTTISAIDTALKHLKKEGIVAVSIYHGGDSGFEERDAVLSFLKTLDKHIYNVIIHQYTNKPNNPPILAIICHND
ncbi:MAG: class I SAM-dependent methyltransferase [Clostridia bacterium]|nr:class I SAM-dependent methyltransferase [Clostridia bacterium]